MKMFLFKSLLALNALAGADLFVNAAPTPDSAITEPILPKQDPWYSAPDNFESAKPGQILRKRVAPGNLTQATGNCSATHNILYRTTDSLGKPSWAVTTLFIPQRRSPCSIQPKSAGALMSYQIPYDSANLNDSPSYALYSGTTGDISEALGKGWYVNVPDYEGPLASFTAGHMSGYATLDSIRAVKDASFGIATDARSALWGYSGGALASEWAAELQPTYAPELKFSGAALGGLTPNITSVLYAVNAQLDTFLVAEGILGLTSQHPAAEAVMLSKLKVSGPFNKTGFLQTRNMTSRQAVYAYAGVDMAQFFNGGLSLLDDPAVVEAINTDGVMGFNSVPKMPILAYKAIADEVSPVADTDALVAKYCNKGATILYERNTVGGHVAEATNGEPAVNEFLDSVLAGTFSMTGCEIRNVTITLSTTPLRRRWSPHRSGRV